MKRKTKKMRKLKGEKNVVKSFLALPPPLFFFLFYILLFLLFTAASPDPDFNPRQRGADPLLEMDELANDELLDELDDEDLEFDLRR